MEYTQPYYVYDLKQLDTTLDMLTAFAQYNHVGIKYAIKANHDDSILKVISNYDKYNIGADCVTIYEIRCALKYFKVSDIVFAGSGKTINEIKESLQLNIGVIHCESVLEFEYILKYKKQYNSKTKIALRINPDFKVNTHKNISTGEKDHKFGMSIDDVKMILETNKNEIYGIHCHIGSQILDCNYFKKYSEHIRNLLDHLDFKPQYLNLGGGLGIDYNNPDVIPDFENWIISLRQHLPISYIQNLVIEPGRSIVGQCGTLIGQVQYIKDNIAILDVGMSQIMRPALYGSKHLITTNLNYTDVKQYKVCGPSCESTDVFGEYTLQIQPQDIVHIHSAGAYVQSMTLNYNMKPQAVVKIK